jgi:hypothetical protein
MGNADRECLSMHDYGITAAAAVTTAIPARRATTPVTPFGQLGRRKIQTT